VAEAAKVIENTQRDLNIALVNDLAILFNKLGIDTLDVLEAAGTKWNFLPFRPGLVGGHCISVDPYYLTHKAQQVGHHPQVILAGRRTNDGMGGYVADQVIRLMTRKRINPVGARVLVLGLAFKENCPDLRNTRVVDIVEPTCASAWRIGRRSMRSLPATRRSGWYIWRPRPVCVTRSPIRTPMSMPTWSAS
jgi:UDP-N-acetyl-D-galactosamine dehydrogenase